MTDVPELRTERLSMRGPRFEDYERWAEIFDDPAVGAGLGKGERGFTPHEAWIDMSVVTAHWALRGFGHWVLEEADGGGMIGRAGLYHPPDWPGMEVGWTIGREHRGKGYAGEAGRAACEWAHRVLGAARIVSLVEPENTASTRVAEKLGLTYERRYTARGIVLNVFAADLPLHGSPD